MKDPIVIPINKLNLQPYASVLCFPKLNETELQNRVEELRSHGVSALEFSGTTSIYGVRVPVLGKGFVGVVVIAHLNGERVAVKIRRLDADRADLLREAEMLKKAYETGAAPKLVAVSRNFLLMQLIEGDLLPAWLEKTTDSVIVKRVLCDVLEACYRLDEAGLDHGELSKAPKHVIIDKQLEPWIVDFETASDKRKPANLPAICHFLFNSPGEVGQLVTARLGKKDGEKIIQALHDYKRGRSNEAFERVVRVCLDGDFV